MSEFAPTTLATAIEHTADESTMTRRATDYQLGNPELPVTNFRDEIVTAVDASQVVVLTAETGAGKSTQVPQFLAEQGYGVIVTQPRVVAARTVAERVREEIIVSACGEEFADFVGYRTARERHDSPNNQILFATDGLQLVRELSGNGVGEKQVLVLDEVHEWNENMEVLVAWAKQHMREDPEFKVVVMSATMESAKLAQYFADDNTREVPIVEVPGRTFEVEKSEGGDVAEETIKFAREGKNTLVFVPGKAEIEEVIAQIKHANIPGAIVLPMHGQLEPTEQRKAFQDYPGVKIIVSTNVAQTSVTINDIDVVVDSGLERRVEVRNGVEGLYLRPISQADCMQRAGRAGRTKAGEYVLAQLGNNPFTSLANREEYGVPEILRTRLDGMVLRLSKNGLDPETLEFYHQPDRSEITSAKRRLQKLGALTEDGQVTRIGRDMERMPIESHYARMMIEARQYGPEVQQQLAAICAIMEVDGITFRGKNSEMRWRNLISGNMQSDPIVELEVFTATQKKSAKEQRDHDIMMKNIGRAREVLRQLRRAEHLRDADVMTPTDEQREQLIKCIVAGMVDQLYVANGYGYRNGDDDWRDISNRSVVRGGRMAVGDPFDLQIQTRRGPRILNVLQNVTTVPSTDVLREVAPQLFSEKFFRLSYTGDGAIVEQRQAYFDGKSTGVIADRESQPSSERLEYIADVLSRGFAPRAAALCQITRDLEDLRKRTPEELPTFSEDDIRKIAIENVPIEVSNYKEADNLLPEMTLADIVGQDAIDRIMASSPDEYAGYKLTYKNGQVYASTYPSSPIYQARSADAYYASLAGLSVFELPDGRPIMYGSQTTFRDIHDKAVEKLQQGIEDAHEAALAEDVERDRLAAVEQEERERAAEAAREEAERKARIEEKERQRQTEFTAALSEAEPLFQKLEEIWISGSIDDLPDDLGDTIARLLVEWENLNGVAGAQSWSSRAGSAIARADRFNGEVTPDSLQALQAHFNW